MENRKNIENRAERKVQQYVKKGFKIFFFIVLGLAIAFLVGYIVMWLWNWLMPELFGLPEVGYWQAVGILVFAKIIFGFGSGDRPSKGKERKKQRFANACSPLRKDFSDWKHYDEFWKEEGEQAYEAYLNRINNIKEG